VADQIRGQSVEQALRILTFSSKGAAHILRKVLNSAIANAEHNHGANIDELRVSAVEIGGAPTFSRYRPRAKGRANQIIKRNSHIVIEVADE
tara:strand:- start:229 stop:504 length:276 start_codon:yes stop_codon:yes gene_type:complete